MKLFVDSNNQNAYPMPDDCPIGRCRIKSEELPPQAESLDFNNLDHDNPLPAVFEITDVPNLFGPEAIAPMLLAAEIKTVGENYRMTYKKLTAGEPAVKRRNAMTPEETFDHLINRFNLKGKDIARITKRSVDAAYTWTSKRIRNGKKSIIPPSCLELMRYKLGDKKLTLHSAAWRVSDDDRLTSVPIMFGDIETRFIDLPANEQLIRLMKEYNLDRNEIAEMTHKTVKATYQWTYPIDTNEYRKMPEAELELMLLKLGEKPIMLDETVPPALHDRFLSTGMTR